MGKTKGKKGKLPKKIAGVKLPKEARRRAERAIADLKQPIVREMLAGAVAMAATALAKQASAMRHPEQGSLNHKTMATPAVDSASPQAKPAGKSGGEQFAEIATGLAIASLGKFFEKMQAAGEAKKPEAPKI